MRVEASVFINAPKEEVFKLFSDVPNLEQNITAITKAEVLTDGEGSLPAGEVGEGTRWRETRVMFGKEATEEMWISSFNPSDSYEVSAESNGVKYLSVYRFSEENGGTRVDMEFGGEPQSFGAKIMTKLMGWMMTGSLKKALEQDMKELKEKLEQDNA